MKQKTVLDFLPNESHSRYGEGSFLRTPGGDILYAYSEFSVDPDDGGRSNIALLRSRDEGETWTYDGIIADAKADFGLKNVMCVSAMPTSKGEPCFYYLIKEADGSSSFGRTVSVDGGKTFAAERCVMAAEHAYYVLENDRMIRMPDGRILTAASRHDKGFTVADIVTFESDDDGKTFRSRAEGKIRGTRGRESDSLEEPGLLPLPDGRILVWARSFLGCQYTAYADAALRGMTPPEPSRFTSPRSPMLLKRETSGTCYAVYNPIPNYNGRDFGGKQFDRTPLALEISRDGGMTWGGFYLIEKEERYSYCYPCVFETNDGALLVAYMYENEEIYPKDAMRMVKLMPD